MVQVPFVARIIKNHSILLSQFMPFLIVSLSFFSGPTFPRHYEASLSPRAQLSELPTVRPVLLHKGKEGNALCAGFRAESFSRVNYLFTFNIL
jgi:hypothetical protein